MSTSNTSSVWRQGLWDNNPGLVQLLGLCPLLAVTTNTINGVGLALATLVVLVITNTVVSAFRHHIARDVRIPVFVLIIASSVTTVELLLQAYFFELSRTLGIFIPLIVTNCTILARAEACASRQPVSYALKDALAQGLGFGWVLICLGALRELLGTGQMFAQAHRLFGFLPNATEVHILPFSDGLLLALLPPGAFILLGLMVAGKQYWLGRSEALTTASKATITPNQDDEQTTA